MKRKLLAILLIAAALLTACSYVVVEDAETTTIGSLFGFTALAEETARPMPTEIVIPPIDESTPDEPEEIILSNGSKGEEVKRLQALLKEYGFLNGSADGIFGKKTEQAVKQAQEYKNELDMEKEERVRKEVLARVKAAFEKTNSHILALTPETEEKKESISEKGFTLTTITPNVKPVPEKEKFKATGEADKSLMNFLETDFNIYRADMTKGAKGSDVRRLQTRLNSMYYLYGGIDGQYGTNTTLAVKYFQRLNGLKETGIADEDTQRTLFSDKCKVSDYPMYRYTVEIDISKQRVYVYEWNYGAYSKLVKTMKCTTGAVETPTPLGTFKMGGPCGRWYYFKKFECWAQYASRINGGILFHSVIYSEKDESTLRQGSVDALGTRGSHGCVRLTVEDAKWIYKNIPAGTTCKIYN